MKKMLIGNPNYFSDEISRKFFKASFLRKASSGSVFNAFEDSLIFNYIYSELAVDQAEADLEKELLKLREERTQAEINWNHREFAIKVLLSKRSMELDVLDEIERLESLAVFEAELAALEERLDQTLSFAEELAAEEPTADGLDDEELSESLTRFEEEVEELNLMESETLLDDSDDVYYHTYADAEQEGIDYDSLSDEQLSDIDTPFNFFGITDDDKKAALDHFRKFEYKNVCYYNDDDIVDDEPESGSYDDFDNIDLEEEGNRPELSSFAGYFDSVSTHIVCGGDLVEASNDASDATSAYLETFSRKRKFVGKIKKFIKGENQETATLRYFKIFYEGLFGHGTHEDGVKDHLDGFPNPVKRSLFYYITRVDGDCIYTGKRPRFSEAAVWFYKGSRGFNNLLEVDHSRVLPYATNIKLSITSDDVIHSWAVPSFGIKVDAIPGRINQTSLIILHPGIFMGQCSELCGVLHSFMPINVEAIHPEIFFEEYNFVMREQFK